MRFLFPIMTYNSEISLMYGHIFMLYGFTLVQAIYILRVKLSRPGHLLMRPNLHFMTFCCFYQLIYLILSILYIIEVNLLGNITLSGLTYLVILHYQC